jgi:hypothetical protein
VGKTYHDLRRVLGGEAPHQRLSTRPERPGRTPCGEVLWRWGRVSAGRSASEAARCGRAGSPGTHASWSWGCPLCGAGAVGARAGGAADQWPVLRPALISHRAAPKSRRCVSTNLAAASRAAGPARHARALSIGTLSSYHVSQLSQSSRGQEKALPFA